MSWRANWLWVAPHASMAKDARSPKVRSDAMRHGLGILRTQSRMAEAASRVEPRSLRISDARYGFSAKYFLPTLKAAQNSPPPSPCPSCRSDRSVRRAPRSLSRSTGVHCSSG